MRKIIIFLMACILIIACNPTKRITTDKVKEKIDSTATLKSEIKSETTASIDTKKVAEKTIEQIEKETAQFEAILVTYDTNKPIDTNTGKPPVFSELTIKKAGTVERTSNNKEKVTDGDKSDYKSEIKQSTENKVKLEKVSEIKKTDETKTRNPIAPPGFIIATLLILIISLIAYLKKKWIINTIKRLFKN